LKAALEGALGFLPIMAQGTTANTTPLMMAVQAQEGQLVRTLLDTFDDAQLQINYSAPGNVITALCLAIIWENIAVVKALLARGATPPPQAVSNQLLAKNTPNLRAIASVLSGASLQVAPHILVPTGGN
jgi:ankyrin repeat protein